MSPGKKIITMAVRLAFVTWSGIATWYCATHGVPFWIVALLAIECIAGLLMTLSMAAAS